MPKLTQRMVDGLEATGARYEVADSEVPGLRVRVNGDGSKTFALRYRLAGRQVNAKLGTAAELPVVRARELARSILGQAREHEHGRADAPVKRNERPAVMPTLAVYVEGPYARAVAHTKSGPLFVKRLSTAFKGEIWGMRLDSPKLAAAVSEWKQTKLDAGLKATTINRDLQALRAVFSHAVEAELLPAHPLARVKLLKVTEESRVRFLSAGEEERLYAALDAREERIRAERERGNEWRRTRGYAEMVDLHAAPYADFVRPMVLLALNSGMRRGELFSLAWGSVDFEARMLTVTGATAKSGRTRRIPLNSVALDTLDKWRGMCTDTGPDALVFPSPQTGGRLDNINSTWARLMREAGIVGFRFHDARHHFASRLAMAGVPLYVVKELLGHSSLEMTQKYAHLSPESTLNAVELLATPRGTVVPFPGSKQKG